MNNKHPLPKNASRGRPVRVLLSLTFLLSVIASVVLVNVIASRLPTRLDVTSLGIHRLSPRTSAILDSLGGEYEIVLAGPWSDPAGRAGLDPRVVRQVIDTLHEIARQSPRLRVTVIDTMTDSGNTRFRQTIARLVERDRTQLEDQDRQIGEAIGALDHAGSRLGQLTDGLRALAGGIGEDSPEGGRVRGQLVNLANNLRQLSDDLASRSAASADMQSTPMLGSDIGQLDQAQRIIESALSRLHRELVAISPTLRSIASATGTPVIVADRLPALAGAVDGWRDDVARQLDALGQVEPSDVIRIARAMEQASVALVIGPDSLTAIAMDAMFPTTALADQDQGLVADLRGHTESVVILALAALLRPNSPIVVFMHGNPSANLFESGVIEGLRRDLASRRVDTLEWAVVVDASRPSLAELDPAGTRPVVYVVIATDASVSMGDDPALSGPSRARALAAAVRGVIEDGQPVLLSLMPSLAGMIGGEDELAAVIEPFGLHSKSTTPILLEYQGPDGRVVQAGVSVLAAESDGPIGQSLGTLPTTLRWATPIERTDGDVGGEPILTIDEDFAWAESEFQQIWQARGDATAWGGEGLPTKSAMLDDVSGPWQIAWSASKPNTQGGSQRLVVVGANGWFFDSQRSPTSRVQGVTVNRSPGNAQLFESSLLWLSGQDELIAQGPSARAVARIGDISPARRRAIAWGLIAGLPLGVLLLGLVWRLVRG